MGFIMKKCYTFDWNDIFSILKKRKYTFFQHSFLKILPIPLLTFVLDNPHESFCCETKKNTKTIWIFDDFSIATVSSISLKFLAYMMSFLELGFLVEYIKNHLKAPDDENQKHPILLKKKHKTKDGLLSVEWWHLVSWRHESVYFQIFSIHTTLLRNVFFPSFNF